MVAPAGKILTPQFGSWDSIIEAPDGARWLCAACAWAYRAVPYRRTPTIITWDEGKAEVRWASKADLSTILSRPVPANTAVCIPLSGKKLVLPTARWGQVATDGRVLLWGARNNRQLRAAQELRALGVLEPHLAEPSPPWSLISATDPAQHQRIRDLWSLLKPVREDKTMLPFIQNISRKDKPQ